MKTEIVGVELLACPFCGGIPKSSWRPESKANGGGFVAFVACYCGGYSATAHQMGCGNKVQAAIADVTAKWNRRPLAQPASEAVAVAVAVAHKHPAECYSKGTPAVHGQVHDGIVAGLMRALARPPAPAVPDGYALVPVEPTIQMIAAMGFCGDIDLAIGHAAIAADLAITYRAVLAAAPGRGDETAGKGVK